MRTERRSNRFRLFLAAFIVCLISGLALWVASFSSPRPAFALVSGPGPGLPSFGPDIHVNPSPSPYPRRHRNLSMAISPLDPGKIVAAFDYGDPNDLSSGYSLSTDSGQTWAGTLLTGPWGGPSDLSPSGNPQVANDAQGTFFYSTQVASQPNSLNGYCVLTSTNGLDWSDPVQVKVTGYQEYRDQAFLGVDDRSTGQYAGSAYMIWRYFGANYEGAWLTLSRDKGATWTEQVQVSDDANSYVYGPSVAAASNGWVYAAFSEFDLACVCNPPKLFLDRSTDGGQTWGTDRLVTGSPITSIGAPDWKGYELTLIGRENNNDAFRINHFPSFVVSPTDPNTVYMVWNDGRWDSTYQYLGNLGRHGDISFSRTTDGGQTWSAPQRLNDDPMGNGVDQWQPKIAVDAGGTLGVVWYDRRDSLSGYDYDLYYSQSTDGGSTWSPNQRVSDRSSDPMAVPDWKGMGDIGSRNSLVFGPGYVIPGWVDSRRGSAQDFYADRGLIDAPTATPTSTATSTPSATATARVTLTPCAVNFSDVSPGDYFYEGVRYLSCAGAISGYADGTFRPYNNTTRGQLSKIIVLAEGWPIDTTGGPHFSDVPTSNPFYQYIETTYNHNIISGYSDGTFRWGNNITRAQLSKIVVSAEGWTIDSTGGPHFSDVPADDPFYGFIETAYNHNIISGYADGSFRPGNNATRGQISKIVFNAVTQLR